MDEKVKKILEKKYGYDFESEWFTHEIMNLVEETIDATKDSINEVELTYGEKVAIYERAKKIAACDLSWKEKYDMIFSKEISHKLDFDYYNPDSDYDDDVLAFMNGFDEYMKKQEIIKNQIG